MPSSLTIEIRPFAPGDEAEIIDLILTIQRSEFALSISARDQPDLRQIPTFYQNGCGNFLVATADGVIIGTIGMKDIGNGQGALRKMFVAAPYRGKELGIAGRLLSRMLEDAVNQGLTDVFLGTTEKFLAAHRFYEKHGFDEVAVMDLPAAFPRMTVDNKFYRRRLDLGIEAREG